MASSIRLAMAEAAKDSQRARDRADRGRAAGFCAGADMDRLVAIPTDGSRGAGDPTSRAAGDVGDAFDSPVRTGAQRRVQRHDPLLLFHAHAKMPILAAINGPVAGIGLIMTLYADMRFVSDKAVLTTSFAATRGLIAEHGISWLLPRLIGPAHAFDLLLSARKISPQEARKIGLVNKVLGADNVPWTT